ncbi:hypothetical protein AMECASPLE_032154, partial [Ameca splendens]
LASFPCSSSLRLSSHLSCSCQRPALFLLSSWYVPDSFLIPCLSNFCSCSAPSVRFV